MSEVKDEGPDYTSDGVYEDNKFTPVDHNPYAYTMMEHDPFAFSPVDNNPFEQARMKDFVETSHAPSGKGEEEVKQDDQSKANVKDLKAWERDMETKSEVGGDPRFFNDDNPVPPARTEISLKSFGDYVGDWLGV